MNTSVETLAQIDATAAFGLPLSGSAETGLAGTTPKDPGLLWTPNLAKALHCSRAAQREERNGFKYTAAMKWRNAAELFAPDAQAVEYCWHEWERIMQLPRRLAGPDCAAPTISRVIEHRCTVYDIRNRKRELAGKNFKLESPYGNEITN